MAFILRQNDVKKTVSKMIDGRLIYKQVVPGDVLAQEALGFRLSQIDMTRNPKNRFKFLFKKIFSPNAV